MRRLVALASLPLALWAAPVIAQISQGTSILKGSYGATSMAICNYASGAVVIVVSEGIHRFHGDGTGTVAEASSSSTAGAIGSTSRDHHTYTFKYTVDLDDNFTVTMDPGSFSGTTVSGLTFSIDQLAPITGVIGENANTLTGATLESTLETLTSSNGVMQQRKCHRSRTFNKVGEE